MRPPRPVVTTELRIKKFDINSLARDSTICIIAKRRCGKSYLCRDIMYHHRDLPKGIVISGTEHCSPFYQDFVPDSYIYSEYNSQLLRRLFDQQTQIIRRDGGKNDKNSFFLIMDDVLSDSNIWKKDPMIKRCLFEGRHVNLFMVLILQYCMAVDPALRSNFDYIFIYRDNIKANRRRLYENFAGMIPTFAMFETLMDQCTSDYTCLVINNNSTSNKLEDILFFYKACPDHGTFRVGSPAYWRLHDERYREQQALDSSTQINAGDDGNGGTHDGASNSGRPGSNVRIILRPSTG